MYSYCKSSELASRVKFPVLCVLIFIAFASRAQQQQAVGDKIGPDTAIGIPDTPDQESGMGEVQDEKTDPVYFLKNSDTGNITDSLMLRHIPDSIIATLKQDAAFWYTDYDFKKTSLPQSVQQVPLIRQKWFQVLLWVIIIGGFSFFIMWYLAGSNIGLFRKKHRYIDSDDDILETEDIFRIHYQKEIEKAVLNGDYRLAIRLMYMQLLKKLSEKDFIRYKQESTNFDYLLQLQSTVFHLDFFRITRNYEYSWYGLFDVNAESFIIIQNDFKYFEHKLGMS